jgi:hypothetical protein
MKRVYSVRKISQVCPKQPVVGLVNRMVVRGCGSVRMLVNFELIESGATSNKLELLLHKPRFSKQTVRDVGKAKRVSSVASTSQSSCHSA